MCCHICVGPIPDNHEEILGLAGFKWTPAVEAWVRGVSHGRSIWCKPVKDGVWDSRMPAPYLRFSLVPMIGGHSVEEHVTHQASASIAFEVARVLAEQNDGTVWQGELVGECRKELPAGSIRNGGLKYGTTYPRPLMYEDLCYGFRIALERGAAQLPEKDADSITEDDLTLCLNNSTMDMEE